MKNTGKESSFSAMEPMLPDLDSCPALIDLATELVARASELTSRWHPLVISSFSELVRSMNCYYSNLIEGHNTHPRDIDRALHNDFSKDPYQRALQLEAKAHIEVQRMIDFNQLPFAVSADFIQSIHRLFCERLPKSLLEAESPNTHGVITVDPGQWRRHFVQVGLHVPPSPDSIADFLDRFTQAYNLNQLSNKIQRIVAVAASHHRLLWIHPFLDGNGRVARLFSQAFLSHVGIGSSLWSIARGLARRQQAYKVQLQNADSPRRGDLDGRGALSEKGLKDFCLFFLETCLDQVNYMGTIIEPTELIQRIRIYVEEEQASGRLPKGSFALLREVLLCGEIQRGQVAAITGYQERQARTVLNHLVKAGMLISNTPRGAVRLAFPSTVVERWFPKLYP